MADLKVTDANGKEFSFDVSKICDINGDMGNGSPSAATDSVQRNRVSQVHDIEYVNTKGEALDMVQFQKDVASGKTNVVALDVEMEATHSGKNHNYVVYYEDSMERDAESFVNPFKKPMLKNHNDYSGEPLGRIQQAWFGPSALTDERSAIHLKARVTDADAMPKFLDGRYGTVSIGGTMGTVTCNICGKTILKDGKFKFCGHWRGETYKDQVCYWGAKDIDYHEVSTVNNPADDFAQIMKVTVLTDSDDKKDNQTKKEESNMDGTNTSTGTTQQANVVSAKQQICDMIDSLLGNTATTADASAPAAAPAEGTPATPPADGQQTDASQVQAGGTTVADSAELDKVKKELEDAKAKITSLETELADAKTAKETAETEAKDTKAQVDALQDKCIALATANKELVADSVMAKETFADDAAKDTRKKELMAMSMKDLNDLATKQTTTDAQPAQRTPGVVTNPGLADTSKDNGNTAHDSNGGSTDTNNKATDNAQEKNLQDFTNDIVGKLFK